MSARYYKMRSGGVVYPARLVEDPARGADPVVVIDPEDREQVDRLERLMADNCGWSRSEPMRTQRADGLQDALRSLIAPPEPPEPKGLGAVVEAIYGNHFVRIGDGREPWQHVGSGGSRCEWSAIAAVKVLSEGVTA